jgi:predicted RNase H-like nuclease
MTAPVAGVDGCRIGWVVATMDGVAVSRSFATIADANFAVVAVDMPIGLPDTWGRAADRAARAFIRPRGACIFPAPPRPLLAFDTYADANDACKATYERGLTRQSFNLFPKLREVDAVIDATNQNRFAEASPECSFRALTGSVLAPKRTREGREARRVALEAEFGPIERRVPGARTDDVLDAYALLWTAHRHAAGMAICLAGDEIDGRGLVMRIVV